MHINLMKKVSVFVALLAFATMNHLHAQMLATSWDRFVGVTVTLDGDTITQDDQSFADNPLSVSVNLSSGTPPPPPSMSYFLIENTIQTDVDLSGDVVTFSGQHAVLAEESGMQSSNIAAVGQFGPAVVQEYFFFSLSGEHDLSISGELSVTPFFETAESQTSLDVFLAITQYADPGDPFGSSSYLDGVGADRTSDAPFNNPLEVNLTTTLDTGFYYLTLTSNASGAGQQDFSNLSAVATWNLSAAVQPVPEPGTSALIFLGLGSLLLHRKRRQG